MKYKCSFAVLQLCGSGVLEFCSSAVLRFKGKDSGIYVQEKECKKVLQSCSHAVMQSCSFRNQT
jgi:hypothetical protein